MTDKVAEVDQMKGSTLEDISSMVDQINREFKNKQAQLQPLMAELKVQIIIIFVYCFCQKLCRVKNFSSLCSVCTINSNSYILIYSTL